MNVKHNFIDLWDEDDNMTKTIAAVKAHIYNNGPVIAILEHSAAVTMYAGSNTSGIFINSPADKTNFGYRTFKIIGWDIAPGTTPTVYWIMANTFSPNWGMSGYMRVQVTDSIIEGYYGYTS